MPVKPNLKRMLPLIFLIPVLGFQVFVSMGRINEPFLDGRMHWYFDNASFLLRAKHSNVGHEHVNGGSEKPFLNFFGTATYGYDEQGKLYRLKYYSHHPVLSPSLFRLYAKIFGYGHWVPRSFALLLSLATTIVLFLLLRAALKDDLLSGLITLLYTLLPLNFMYMDQWKYEIATNFLIVSCLYCLSRVQGSGKDGPLFLGTVFLLLQAEWMAYLVVPCLLWFLYRKRGEPGYEGLFYQTVLISLLGVLMNFAILYQLGFDLGEMKSAGASRMADGMAAVGIKNWFLWQGSYLEMNFGEANIAVFLMGTAYVCLKRPRGPNIPFWGSLILIFCSIGFLSIFLNLSLIHHYLQWYLGLAYVLLLGGILADLPRTVYRTREVRAIVLAILIPLLFLTALEGQRLNHKFRASTFGKPSDLEAVKRLQKRLMIFSDGRSGPVHWWFSPVVELAQDPVFQGVRGRASVKRIEEVSAIDADKDIVVVLNTEGALKSFRTQLQKQFGIHHVKRLARSRSFSFFKVVDG